MIGQYMFLFWVIFQSYAAEKVWFIML